MDEKKATSMRNDNPEFFVYGDVKIVISEHFAESGTSIKTTIEEVIMHEVKQKLRKKAS